MKKFLLAAAAALAISANGFAFAEEQSQSSCQTFEAVSVLVRSHLPGASFERVEGESAKAFYAFLLAHGIARPDVELDSFLLATSPAQPGRILLLVFNKGCVVANGWLAEQTIAAWRAESSK